MNYFNDLRSCISLCTNISSCNGFSLSLSLSKYHENYIKD